MIAHDTYFGWSTHLPLLKAVIKTFNPEYVLELGSGLYSTPTIRALCPTAVHHTIENDPVWAGQMEVEFGYTPEVGGIVAGVGIATLPKDLTIEQGQQIIDFYKQLQFPTHMVGTRLLFIDNFTSHRNIALNVIGRCFDIILMHDTEPWGQEVYNYDWSQLVESGYRAHHLCCAANWTTALINNRCLSRQRSTALLLSSIVPEIREYVFQNPAVGSMTFDSDPEIIT